VGSSIQSFGTIINSPSTKRETMNRHISPHAWVVVCLVSVGLLAGCGDDDSTTGPDQTTSVSGNSNKAPIAGASVNIHRLNADASVGSFVAGPFTTNASGDWSGTIPAGTTGSLVMVSTGGSYTDEASGAIVTLTPTDTLYGVFQGTSSSVTPQTHATYLAIQAMVAGGTPLSDAITQATNSAVTAFGFNFTTTIPNSGGTTNPSKYADLLGGLSRLLNANPNLTAFTSTPPIDLVIAMATDMADGQLDGLDASGASIQVFTDASHTTTASLPALSALDLSAWLNEANAYAGSTLFNINTVWNPSQGVGGVGGNLGSLVYVGAVNGTTTPDFATTAPGNTVQWFADPNNIEIRIVLADQVNYPGSVETVYFIYNSGAQLWVSHGVSGVQGVTVSISGGTTTFDAAYLVDINNPSSYVTLSGTLDNPAIP
jgi:hypothetical protein